MCDIFIDVTLAVFEAAIRVISTHRLKLCLKIRKKEKIWK